jgi:hypothetical protein
MAFGGRLAAGVAIGIAIAATPAASHIGSVTHLWNHHIKPKADKRYVNEGCKSGTIKYGGVCYETTNRAAQNIYGAAAICGDAGGFLPSNLDLRSAAIAKASITLDGAGEWSSTEFYDDTNQWQGFVVFENGANVANDDISSFKFRCAYSQGTGVGIGASRTTVTRVAPAGRGGSTN